MISARPARGPELSSLKSRRDLRDFDGQAPERARIGEHVSHALRHAEPVGRRLERQPRVVRQVLDGALGVVVAGVESSADGRRAEVEFEQLDRVDGHLRGRVQHVGGVAAEHLSDRDRHGVLEVGAADLQDRCELVRLALERLAQGRGRFRQAVRHRQDGEPHRRGKHVVGGLSHVDVVVRVHQRVLAARAAEDLGGAVGEHLVRVHVVRGAGPRLVHVDDELVAELAGEHFIRRSHDRIRDLRCPAAPASRWPAPPLS